MIAAASAPPAADRRDASSGRPSVPGSTVSTSFPSTSGTPNAAEAALTEVTPGTISVRNRALIRLCMCM